jgi:HK97 family phage major capsid protein
MKPNIAELTTLTQEASILASKARLTKEEQRKFHWLTGAAIPAVKAGATLAEVNERELNAVELRNGFRPTKISRISDMKRAKAAFMRKLVKVENDSREIRSSEAEGSILSMIGTYMGLGSFVPTAFADRVFGTMAAVDPLFDEDVVTLIKSKTANPMVIPTFDDIEVVAQQVGEASLSGTDTLLANPNNVKLGAYSFCSPVHAFSMEVFDDVDEAARAYDLFAGFAGNRVARGAGAKLVNGAGGATTPNGIVTALASLGVNGVTAAGSSANTGNNMQTGANSIGSADLANLYFSVNSAYRSSPKCFWLMNDATLKFLCTIVTISGLPLVNLWHDVPQILGKPIRISPSLGNIGSSAVPILFGDFSYVNSRIVTDDLTRIQLLKEAPGLVENGLVGLRYFVRVDGALAFNSPNVANCPIQPLICHS